MSSNSNSVDRANASSANFPTPPSQLSKRDIALGAVALVALAAAIVFWTLYIHHQVQMEPVHDRFFELVQERQRQGWIGDTYEMILLRGQLELFSNFPSSICLGSAIATTGVALGSIFGLVRNQKEKSRAKAATHSSVQIAKRDIACGAIALLVIAAAMVLWTLYIHNQLQVTELQRRVSQLSQELNRLENTGDSTAWWAVGYKLPIADRQLKLLMNFPSHACLGALAATTGVATSIIFGWAFYREKQSSDSMAISAIALLILAASIALWIVYLNQQIQLVQAKQFSSEISREVDVYAKNHYCNYEDNDWKWNDFIDRSWKARVNLKVEEGFPGQVIFGAATTVSALGVAALIGLGVSRCKKKRRPAEN